MNTSQIGINFIKKHEGCVLRVYIDIVGVKTMGYGHTGPDVNRLAVGTPITQGQADACLKADLIRFEKNVESYNSIYHWTQNEFDALVSFAFNVGSINQLTANGKRTKAEVAKKIIEYNKAGGKVVKGLADRRKAEQAMFLGSNNTEAVSDTPTLKIGSKGYHVQIVQTYLSALGYAVGKVDGIYGEKTKSAVKEYQISRGLKIDGIWGPQCWKTIKK